MSFLDDFIIKNTKWGERLNEDVLDLQSSLENYAYDMSASTWEAQGVDPSQVPFDLDFYEDIPSPYNRLQYPTPEIVDVMRHYYGPMAAAEEHGVMKGYGSALKHEMEPGSWATPALREQTLYDIYNNYISLMDYMKDSKGLGKGAFNVLTGKGREGLIPPGEFEALAKIALERTKIPPAYEERY